VTMHTPFLMVFVYCRHKFIADTTTNNMNTTRIRLVANSAVDKVNQWQGSALHTDVLCYTSTFVLRTACEIHVR